ALHVDQVLYADRHAMQRPEPGAVGHGLLRRLGVAPRLVRHHHAKAVEPGLGALDRPENGVDIVDGREFARANERGRLYSRHEQQSGHLSPSPVIRGRAGRGKATLLRHSPSGLSGHLPRKTGEELESIPWYATRYVLPADPGSPRRRGSGDLLHLR